jgi:hypothetical protein
MSSDFIYRYLEIPNYTQVSKEILEFDKKLNNTRGFVVIDKDLGPDNLPTLYQWFGEINLTVKTLCSIYLKPSFRQKGHIDIGPWSLAINIPATGCEFSKTRFYKNKGQIVTKYTPTKLPYSEYVDDSPEEIGSYTLDKPVLVNVKMPHSVFNGIQPRTCLSFRFEQDPWFLASLD